MGDLDEAVRLQPTTVTQSVSGGTIRRQSVSAAFTLDGMTAEPVIISTLDKTGADAVLNAPSKRISSAFFAYLCDTEVRRWRDG